MFAFSSKHDTYVDYSHSDTYAVLQLIQFTFLSIRSVPIRSDFNIDWATNCDKNITTEANSLEPGETPSYLASHQAPDYLPTWYNRSNQFEAIRSAPFRSNPIVNLIGCSTIHMPAIGCQRLIDCQPHALRSKILQLINKLTFVWFRSDPFRSGLTNTVLQLIKMTTGSERVGTIQTDFSNFYRVSK